MARAPIPTPGVLPPWPGRSLDAIASHLDGECEWLIANGVLPTELVTRNRQVAEAALRPWTPVFTHGDLQVAHVFVDVDEITGVIDWSEAGPGDALYDLASLTLGHEEHLDDVAAGYGTDVDLDVIREPASPPAVSARCTGGSGQPIRHLGERPVLPTSPTAPPKVAGEAYTRTQSRANCSKCGPSSPAS